MILKYKKKDSSAWFYEHVGNVIIGKVDFSNIITKYISKDSGEPDINDDNFSDVFNNVYDAVEKEVGRNSLTGDIDSIKDLLKKTYYVIVKENNYNGNLKLISTEAYLMTDEGKTIERLL